MGKQYIKGFSGLRYWPVSKNDDTGYTTGEMEAIPGAQSATMDRSTEDYSILADDQIWDSGADFTGETLEITVIELGLPLMAALDGADYDEEEGVYSWGPGKVPPEIAIGFRALKADGTYRMVKYYSCSVTSITAEYATKGQNTEGTISKKTYWTTLIYLFSALANIALCFVLIPPLGISGAAMASALSAILTLLLRTAVGERYYRAILNYRYLALTIGLMTAASCLNLLLTGIWKYAALVLVLALACALFHAELRTLWTTAGQVLSALRGHFRKEERHGR